MFSYLSAPPIGQRCLGGGTTHWGPCTLNNCM